MNETKEYRPHFNPLLMDDHEHEFKEAKYEAWDVCYRCGLRSMYWEENKN